MREHEYLFPFADGNHHGTIRAWRPGDGLMCSFAPRASVDRPCGRPVAVRVTSWLGRGSQLRTSIVCMYHIGAAFLSPASLRAEAERVAREKIVVDHWDDYQGAVRAELNARIEAALIELPEDLRQIIAEGIHAHREEPTEEES